VYGKRCGAHSEAKRFLSPEERLLTLAARIDLEAGNRSLMGAILQNGVDWPKVMLYAKRFSIEPLLYRHLSMWEHSRYVPDDVFLALKRAYQLQAMRNMRIQGCIHQILRAMNENNISVIPLKGAFLATHIYPDSALRPMNDIDLLFRQEDMARACELLVTLGYDPPDPHAYQSPLHEKLFCGMGETHLPPLADHMIARVEAHSTIVGGGESRMLPPDLIWRKSIENTGENYCFRGLHPEHQILYLCHHLYKHFMSGLVTLYWFCDIHEIVRRYGKDLNWDSVFQSAEEAGVEDQVKLILGLMKRNWGSPLPEVLGKGKELRLSELGDPGKNVRKAQKAIVAAYHRRLRAVGRIAGWRNRLMFLWKTVFPTRGNMVYRYHPGGPFSLALHYVLHPLIIARRYTVGLVYNALSLVKRSQW
jgi:hypothetical protein